MEKIKILNRQIGKVNIVEMIGELTSQGPAEAALIVKEKLKNLDVQFALFNLLGLYQFDTGGCRMILEEAGRFQKSALVGSNRLNRLMHNRPLQRDSDKVGILPNIPSAIRYFQEELAAEQFNWPEQERRKFRRIPLALPVEIGADSPARSQTSAVLVTANISETGLMAQFVDSESEELLQPYLDPYDLKMMAIRIFLPGGQGVDFQGKVVDWDRGEHRLHLEFYQSEESARGLYAGFLEGRKHTYDKKEY